MMLGVYYLINNQQFQTICSDNFQYKLIELKNFITCLSVN